MSKLLFSRDMNEAKRLAKLTSQGKLRRLAQGIYSDDLKTPVEQLIAKYWMEIVPHIVSHGILSHVTAIKLCPVLFEGRAVVFLTSSYAKTINLPGLVIKVSKGDYQAHTEQVLSHLARSNVPRMLLENLTTVKGAFKSIKSIGAEGVEKYLTKELRMSGEKRLNDIRDNAKQIAKDFGWRSEYARIDQIISALLGTHPDKEFLKTTYAKAAARKQPYDAERISLFKDLCLYLKSCRFHQRPYSYSKASYKNLAFFESYFSNFIEGTEFIIDEAEDIVFKGTEIGSRHADSHDVLANFNMANDYSEMHNTPKNSDELINILQERHAYLMKERPEVAPGTFKEKRNKAGNTYFVDPDDVAGTLTHGFESYNLLNPGIERALFMQFMISEIHPFNDGNGRLSRIMMNAELVSTDSFKIIIPSVHRDNYLNGLRSTSRGQGFYLFCKVMDQAWAYTESIDWANYSEARAKIESDYAQRIPDEGMPIFNKALRELALSELPNLI